MSYKRQELPSRSEHVVLGGVRVARRFSFLCFVVFCCVVLCCVVLCCVVFWICFVLFLFFSYLSSTNVFCAQCCQCLSIVRSLVFSYVYLNSSVGIYTVCLDVCII